MECYVFLLFFFFNDTATTEIYTLSLHDALPIYLEAQTRNSGRFSYLEFQRLRDTSGSSSEMAAMSRVADRSEEHTSELQSPCNLVCRLLLEKKKQTSRLIYVRPVNPPTGRYGRS